MEQYTVNKVDIEKNKELFEYEMTEVILKLKGEVSVIAKKCKQYEEVLAEEQKLNVNINDSYDSHVDFSIEKIEIPPVSSVKTDIDLITSLELSGMASKIEAPAAPRSIKNEILIESIEINALPSKIELVAVPSINKENNLVNPIKIDALMPKVELAAVPSIDKENELAKPIKIDTLTLKVELVTVPSVNKENDLTKSMKTDISPAEINLVIVPSNIEKVALMPSNDVNSLKNVAGKIDFRGVSMKGEKARIPTFSDQVQVPLVKGQILSDIDTYEDGLAFESDFSDIGSISMTKLAPISYFDFGSSKYSVSFQCLSDEITVYCVIPQICVDQICKAPKIEEKVSCKVIFPLIDKNEEWIFNVKSYDDLVEHYSE